MAELEFEPLHGSHEWWKTVRRYEGSQLALSEFLFWYMNPFREAQTKFSKLHLFSGQFYSSGIASTQLSGQAPNIHNSVCCHCQDDSQSTQNRSPGCGGTDAWKSCQKTWAQRLTVGVILDKLLLLSELVPHWKMGIQYLPYRLWRDQKLVEVRGKREGESSQKPLGKREIFGPQLLS